MPDRRRAGHPPKPLTLDDDVADFVQSGVSIVVASADAAGVPHLGFALGCRVAGRPNRVRVFLAEPQCRGLVRSIRDSGRLAAVFSRPQDSRTLQIKGNGAQLRPLTPADRARLEPYLEELVSSLAKIGVAGALMRAIAATKSEDILVAEFAPMAAFTQTPGPLAGNRLPA